MTDKNTSTLGSYVDSAAATIQSGIASLTGSGADQASADRKQAEADSKYEASHTAAKVGGVTATAEGGVAADDPRRSEGSWNQTVGAGKEAIGGLVGSESLKQAGAQQNADGKAQEAQGQLNDLAGGAADRVKGAVGGAVAGLTGDRDAEAKWKDLHDTGKAAQRGVEADLEKTAAAEQAK